jgi:hypothetical protein
MKITFFISYFVCRDAGARIACGVISLAALESSATSNPWNIPVTINDFIKKLFP